MAWSNPSGTGSRPASTVSEAPSSLAMSSFDSTTSTATIGEAPAIRAPWIAESPTPPQPITRTDSPGRTFAVFSTAPTPVMTAHPRRATCSSGRDGSTGNTVFAGTTERSANEDGTLWWIRLPPCEKRVVPSARNPSSKTASRSHTDRTSCRAPAARAAVRQPRADDMVARPDAGDALPELLDHGRALVPEHDRHRVPVDAVHRVVVRTAHARGGHPDRDLPGLRRIELELLDPQVVHVPEHRPAHARSIARDGAGGPRRTSGRGFDLLLQVAERGAPVLHDRGLREEAEQRVAVAVRSYARAWCRRPPATARTCAGSGPPCLRPACAG